MWLSCNVGERIVEKLEEILKGQQRLMALVLIDDSKLNTIEASEEAIIADLATITTDVTATDAKIETLQSQVTDLTAQLAALGVEDPTASALLATITTGLTSAKASTTAIKTSLAAPAPTA